MGSLILAFSVSFVLLVFITIIFRIVVVVGVRLKKNSNGRKEGEMVEGVASLLFFPAFLYEVNVYFHLVMVI